jgi:hypothetical protein
MFHDVWFSQFTATFFFVLFCSLFFLEGEGGGILFYHRGSIFFIFYFLFPSEDFCLWVFMLSGFYFLQTKRVLLHHMELNKHLIAAEVHAISYMGRLAHLPMIPALLPHVDWNLHFSPKKKKK